MIVFFSHNFTTITYHQKSYIVYHYNMIWNHPGVRPPWRDCEDNQRKGQWDRAVQSFGAVLILIYILVLSEKTRRWHSTKCQTICKTTGNQGGGRLASILQSPTSSSRLLATLLKQNINVDFDITKCQLFVICRCVHFIAFFMFHKLNTK